MFGSIIKKANELLNFIRIKSNELQYNILISFLILLIFSSGTIIWYNYNFNRKAFVYLSEKLIEKAAHSSITQTISSLDQAKRITMFSSQFIISPVDFSTENRKLIAYFFEALRQSPQVASIYIGNESGEFLQIVRMNGDKTYRSNDSLLPNNVKFALRTISHEKNIENWLYYDANEKLIDIEKITNIAYDHRVRPWYVSAMQKRSLIWTDIYIFEIERDLGITASMPIVDDNNRFIGIIGTDILMGSISTILKNAEIGKDEISFIMDVKGNLIAHNRIKDILKVEGTKIKTTSIDLSGDKVSYSAHHNYIDLKKNKFTFSKNDIEYLAAFINFPESFDKKWILSIIIPINEFVTIINSTHKITLFISLLTILISIFILFFLTKKISQPIIKLSEAANNLHQFKLEKDINIQSNISEIKLMNDSLSAMQHSLRAFSKFIPKNVVSKLIKKGTDIHIGGKLNQLTIFFSDILNFTTVSEKYPPDKLMLHLSEYFDYLSKTIMELNGTVDKYIGDSIMAFWGAPQHDKQQALHACKAALRCQKTLLSLNRQWRLEKKPEFYTRIGIHTGEVIVGNLGSSDRINYTILGDSVNIAARLEGVNKFYGTKIIISEDLHNIIIRHSLVRPLDVVRLKGKTKGVKIYELVGLKGSIVGDPDLLPSRTQTEFCNLFTDAFNIYLKQHWNEAIRLFEKIKDKFGEEKVTNMYIERCKTLKRNPPGKEWDGVITLKSK